MNTTKADDASIQDSWHKPKRMCSYVTWCCMFGDGGNILLHINALPPLTRYCKISHFWLAAYTLFKILEIYRLWTNAVFYRLVARSDNSQAGKVILKGNIILNTACLNTRCDVNITCLILFKSPCATKTARTSWGMDSEKPLNVVWCLTARHQQHVLWVA